MSGRNSPGRAERQRRQPIQRRGIVGFGQVDQPSRQDGERFAMLFGSEPRRRNTEFFEPLGGQIAASDGCILENIPRDVGQLKGDTQIACPVQGWGVACSHDDRHHHAHHAGNVIAVLKGVLDTLILATLHIHSKSTQVIERVALRNAVLQHHLLERGESGFGNRLSGKGAVGRCLQFRQQLARRALNFGAPPHTQQLPINHVIAVPAPCVQQHCAAPGIGLEQPRRGGEAFRAGANGLRGMLRQRLRHQPSSLSISPAVALAEPTTPGTPAPGWVPAPTRYRLRITSSRLCGRNQAL
jgi:hypothetical protein